MLLLINLILIKFRQAHFVATVLTGITRERNLLGYEPKKVKNLVKVSPTLSPQSPHENVKIGGQESKQEQHLLNDQSEDVASTWTKVQSNRTTRLNNRTKALKQSEEKFVTPSPPVTVKGSFPSLTTEPKGSAYFKALRSAKEAKSQKEFAALQTQVVTLTTTLIKQCDGHASILDEHCSSRTKHEG